VAGPGGALQVLLSSGSFAELTDGVEFLGAVQQSASDLVLLAEANRERLRRSRDRLAELSAEQAATIDEMKVRQEEIGEKIAEIEDLVDELTAKLEKERAAERRRRRLLNQPEEPLPPGPSGSGFQACPVAGPNSFIDSWGAPRSGGRSHEGTDIMAAFGTPVVAATDGVVRYSSDPLGGLSAYVNAPNGDETYYAHLSSQGPASGSVSAGTLIGHVGSTGNAGDINHLHFSYRPGGVPTNPYPYLTQVC
jgi:murein DD-endopeptidase MepM/ murein hydrolase activator NlpD